RITKLVAGRRYTLTETIPAAGYATAESVTFTVSDTGEVQKVELRDDITKVEISKTDLTTGKELPGATLQVTDQAGKVIDKWVSGTKPHRITKLVAGRRYTLTETIPAAGYATAKSVTFTVSDTGEVQKVELRDDITKVEISKTDLTTGKELPGATLQVTDQAGKVIDKWVSGTKPHRITKLVAGQRYTLTETIPAAGYATAESVTFTVSDTGEVQKIRMEDDITKIVIQKVDGTTKRIQGEEGEQEEKPEISEEVPKEETSEEMLEGVPEKEIEEKTSEGVPEEGTEEETSEGVPEEEAEEETSEGVSEEEAEEETSEGVPEEGTEKEPENPSVSVTWTGTDAEGGTVIWEAKSIFGATLQVTDTEGTVVDEWITDGREHIIEKLEAGKTYILTEVHPADGYATAEPMEFTVADTGEAQLLVMEDDITEVEISKKDLTTGERLPGASLQVTDAEGNLVAEWSSEEEPHRITRLVAGQTYTLTEIRPADGYATAEPVTFTVEDTGEIQKVEMEDDTIKVDFSKTDLTTGEELPGASLEVTDAKGTLVEKWISGGEPHRITGLVAGQTYTLTEVRPADGYATAESVIFTVADTGDIQKVKMEDDTIKTEIFKVDAADREKALSGALLQIIDKEGILVEEWISGEEPKLVEKLTAGETYLLHEEEAPEGYLTAPDMEFTVSDTGEVQTVVLEDELAVINLEVAKKTIRRTQTGDTYKYTITTLHNASNTSLENFTCTDYLPEQAIIRELHTGTFSDELDYSISYQTNHSDEWHFLVGEMDSKANHIISFTGVALDEGEQITAYRYEFGTVPADFQIAEQNPIYFTKVKPGVEVTEEMLTNIMLSGDWRGVKVTDKDDTVTLLFEGEIEPRRSLGQSLGRILTGDRAPVVYLSLSATAAAGVIVLLLKKRRKDRCRNK
ncbi:MAG: hypothetical protein HFI63_04085, partial [Lachnospiraceae bacterium]|nr:hypothetical protein [Lachnospiraceae bacterium]